MGDAEGLLSVASAWMEAGWRRPDPEAFRQLHAEHFLDHNPAGRPPDRDGFWAGVVGWFAAFPDLIVDSDDLIAAPGRGLVTVRWSAAGTHQGPFLGIPPTGRRVIFTGIEVIRIEGGQVCERWGEWNGMEILEQLRGLPDQDVPNRAPRQPGTTRSLLECHRSLGGPGG